MDQKMSILKLIMRDLQHCVALNALFVNLRYQLSIDMYILYCSINFQFLFIIIHWVCGP